MPAVWTHPTDWFAVCVEILRSAGLLFALCWVLTFCSALCEQFVCAAQGRAGCCCASDTVQRRVGCLWHSPGEGRVPLTQPRERQGAAASDMGCLSPGTVFLSSRFQPAQLFCANTFVVICGHIYFKKSSVHPYRIVAVCQWVGLCYIVKTTIRMESKM